MHNLTFILSSQEIANQDPKWNEKFGAELIFWGIVRKLENGKAIKGIEYSAYPELAETLANRFALEAEKNFGEHKAQIIHRIGFVAVSQPSVVLKVGSCHSEVAYEISQWYLEKIKKILPIWKKIVY
jgi:molybdopterin synthase catalytic subunit